MFDEKYKTPISIAAKIWIAASLAFGMLWVIASVVTKEMEILKLSVLATIVSGIVSIPVCIALIFILPFIKKINKNFQIRIVVLIGVCFAIAFCYAILCIYTTGGSRIFRGDIVDDYDNNLWIEYIKTGAIYTGIIFTCSVIAVWLNIKAICIYFTNNAKKESSIQININMDTTIHPQNTASNKENSAETSPSNKILTKGIITGVLILVMLIPTIFLTNLVSERKQRQNEIVHEVSSKWGYAQTITGPYLYIPYTIKEKDVEGKIILAQKQLFIFPDSMDVTGEIFPEQRLRSIYNVLLYKSVLSSKGNFNFQFPQDIDPASMQWENARICIGINDFKGIEEKIVIHFNNVMYTLAPGLPTNLVNEHGLSTVINLTKADVNKPIAFNMDLKINGSEQLHFVPLSGNSNYTLHSIWPNPSFDGNTLPKQRSVTDKGFIAKWYFNAANLPFGNVVKQFDFDKSNIAFGVSMLQPADQYAKTMRSVKYAILVIGLSFCLFFIIELMQKKPLHPIQYILVGFALVIFYTLLLSISEFMLFNYAYSIASLATILLITLYAKNHFKSLKTSFLFASVLIGLYGFIFVLIQLEDTALLVGSIGLFMVLALVMYASRKINWYGNKLNKSSN